MNKSIKIDPAKFELKGGGVKFKLKRGEISWAYFPIAYGLLLTISIGIISVLDVFYVWKILLIIIGSLILFKLCFFNSWFRNKIVGLFSKSKEFEEIS